MYKTYKKGALIQSWGGQHEWHKTNKKDKKTIHKTDWLRWEIWLLMLDEESLWKKNGAMAR